MSDVVAAIVAIIQADVASIEGRAFGVELPETEVAAMQTTSAPRRVVVVQPSGGVSPVSGTARLRGQRVDIASYGPTPFEAEALRMEVQSALLSVLRRVAASTLIHWIEDAGGAVSGRDADTRWPLTVQSFQALYSLETVA